MSGMSTGVPKDSGRNYLPLLIESQDVDLDVARLQPPERRRLSEDTTISFGSHDNSLQFPEPGVSSYPRPQKTLAVINSPSRASSPHHEWTMSSETPRPVLQCLSDHANLRERYDHELFRLFRAQAEWMAAVTELCPHIQPRFKDHDGFARVEEAWRDIQHIEPLVRNYHQELKHMEHMPDVVQTRSHLKYPYSPAVSHRDHAAVVPPPELTVEAASEMTPSSVSTDYADLYYQHASAVRWISDDLINLGPRPDKGAQPFQSLGNDDASGDYPPNTLTPYEYAERHLKLLRDLSFERSEAARYKAICKEKNIELEDDVEGTDDSQSDDLYQSILADLEHGAPRVDSIVAVNTGEMLVPTYAPAAVTNTSQASRIEEWATDVASQSDKVVNGAGLQPPVPPGPTLTITEYDEPAILSDNERIELHEGRPLKRRPYRSKSTSAITDIRPNSPNPAQRHRASFQSLCPSRSDSGCDFDISTGLACF